MADTTTPDTLPGTPHVAWYRGRREQNDGKLVHAYDLVDDQGTTTRHIYFGKRLGRAGYLVGDALVLRALGADGSQWAYDSLATDPGTPRVPLAQAQEWRMADQAAQRALEATQAERRRKLDANAALGSLTLDQVRRQLQGTPARQRAALLTLVLERLGV